MDPQNLPRAHILVVEDDREQLRLYAKLLRGHRVTCVTNGTTAMAAVAEEVPDLIILDHVLSDGERGTDLLPRLKRELAHVPVVVVSGTLQVREQIAALQGPRAAHYVLEKPLKLEEFERVVNEALNECGLGETVAMLRSLERSEKTSSAEADRRFTERLDRQHQILTGVRSGSMALNVSALARQFRVSRRTIQRDLGDLTERGQLSRRELDAATEGVPGQPGFPGVV